MWFAVSDSNTKINVDGVEHLLEISKCSYIDKYGDLIYLLNGKHLFVYSNCKLIKKYNMVDITSNKFIINKKIYVSGEDTGCIFIYDINGNILSSFKIGEHISDFVISNDYFYVITYHENLLIKTDLKEFKKVLLTGAPQRIIVDKFLYVLSHDENYSFITQFELNLNEIKQVKFIRQIGDLYKFNNKLIFNGYDYNYVLNMNLNTLSKKKSTGDILCRFSDFPIFESYKRFDLINNIIYP